MCVSIFSVCVCVNLRRASQLVIIRAATQTDPVPGPNISQVQGPRVGGLFKRAARMM